MFFTDGYGNSYDSFAKISGELKEYLQITAAANSSARFSDGKIIGGNTTEKALLEFVEKSSVSLRGAKIVDFSPFSSEKKFSAACVEKNGKKITIAKGAPEIILSRCKFYLSNGKSVPLDKAKINKKCDEYARSAMRLIAIAVGSDKKVNDLADDMTLVGIAAIRDDVRPEAKLAVADVKKAGIQVVMITGDRLETAEAIAREAGILESCGVVLTSSALAKMSDNEIRNILPQLRVVARALPGDKSRLVKIAQSMNLVVGMTGDGVNDAPALKLADVGFAMGGGSEAAAAASDIVIIDDNFKSIRNAVLYGRTIYNSIKKFVRFQLTINIAAVGVSMLGPIVGVEKPLDISQMIWTNLMIDSLAAIAFGGEPALARYMNERPRKRDEKILDTRAWAAIITGGLYICALSLVFFISPVIKGSFRSAPNDIYFYTGYFTFFIFISIFNAFNSRCDGIDLMENLSLNKPFIAVMSSVACVQVLMTYIGGAFLRTAGLSLAEWIVSITLALTIIPVDILQKLIVGKRIK